MLEIERKIARLRKMWTEMTGRSGQIYVQDRVDQYRNMWRTAAERIGGDFTVLENKLWQVELNGRKVRILNDVLPFDDPVTLEIAGMKPVVYRMLSEKGLPVPEYLVFNLNDWRKGYDFLKRYPEGVVIKPAHGTSSGQGVTTHILTKGEVRKAAILASLYCRDLIAEPMIPGECFRLLVLDGKVIHAVCRRGSRLRGDGKTSIAGLIKAENGRRRENHKALLDIDRDTRFTLRYQHLSLDSVPAKDQVFLVKSVDDPVRKRVEVRTVYNETVTDIVDDSMIKAAERAAGILGSRFVGVDFITVDAAASLEDSRAIINELNTTPGLHHHYDAAQEKVPGAALAALQALLGLSD
jgi:D-alanine-D-alanine ligase-like ATP-grasp enzyme